MRGSNRKISLTSGLALQTDVRRACRKQSWPRRVTLGVPLLAALALLAFPGLSVGGFDPSMCDTTGGNDCRVESVCRSFDLCLPSDGGGEPGGGGDPGVTRVPPEPPNPPGDHPPFDCTYETRYETYFNTSEMKYYQCLPDGGGWSWQEKE